MQRNPVGWFEIYVQDMDRARAFYEQTLQVTLNRLAVDGIEMWAFDMQPDAGGCSGALIAVPGVASGGNSTIVYFSCADCAVEAERAVAAGGNLARGKMSIGEYGFVAMVIDPDGNLIGLHSNA